MKGIHIALEIKCSKVKSTAHVSDQISKLVLMKYRNDW